MPKSYSQFKYEDVSALGLKLKLGYFPRDIMPVEPTDFLKTTLEINTRQRKNTEKAKSEFIIAPVLFEIARKFEDKVSFFSGYNFDVDKGKGLAGFCDFLFTREPQSPIIQEPVFCIAEAKNDNLEKGIPQCVAEMYAARLFNQRHNKPIEIIYGCTTTGYNWQFLKLQEQTVLIDNSVYELDDLNIILGILQFIVNS